MEEVILRYGLPRKLISDHGSQFVGAVMQQLCFILNIDQDIIPVYHPQANPVERKNRDLKPRIAILVQNRHDEWEDKLPSIRFALNSAKCDTTEITPYLKKLARISSEVRERIEEKQDQRKTFYDKRHRPGPLYHPGDKVWVTLHPLSNAAHKNTAKFMPKRDGPYIIVTQRSLTTYEVANPNNPHEVLGPYHSSALRPCIDKEATPGMPLRKRGRPRKDNSAGSSSRTIPRNQRGSVTNGNRVPSPGRMDKPQEANSQPRLFCPLVSEIIRQREHTRVRTPNNDGIWYTVISVPSPGQPIGVTVHFTQQPIREQSLSSQPSQKLFQIHHPDEAPKSRLPDPIDYPIAFMPPSRMCPEFEPSTTKDPSCMGEVHVESVESSNVLLLEWLKEASSSIVLVNHGSKSRSVSKSPRELNSETLIFTHSIMKAH
ncbi:integrase catalytic domain-containing protein [Trichonephila clavipes]|nr:integrase catalytic domain-containing protein [Trichonephila clavipes]